MRAFRLIVPSHEEEIATAALWEAGTTGIELRQASPGTLELIAYFPDNVDPRAAPGLPAGTSLEPVPIPDVDWVARFRENFRSFRAGRFLVVPIWEAPPSGADVLRVEPGRAFGTGTHETTRLCLAALEDLAARRRLGRTLDLGCGTGLLAVAAARLGSRPVYASDIDPEATSASRLHSRLNQTPLGVILADGGRPFARGAFDLVLANLMAPLLIERAEEIQRLLAPGAALVLSGLLADDVRDVAAAYSDCGPPDVRHDGEWAALLFEPQP